MKPGKRTHGAASLKLSYSTIVNSSLRGGLLELRDLFTPEAERGKGLAAALLANVCAEADRARKVLILLPDSERLAAFYARFGFVLIQREPVLMTRPPRI